MAGRSEYQALKVFLSSYGDAQRAEKRLADRLDRLERELGRGAPDPQPGVSLREKVSDFLDIPGTGPVDRPGDPRNKNQGGRLGNGDQIPDIGTGGQAGGSCQASDPAPGPGVSSPDFGPGFPDPGGAPKKTGPDIRSRGDSPGYRGGDSGRPSKDEDPGDGLAGSSRKRGGFLNGHPLPSGQDASGNFWKQRRRDQCVKELEEQRVSTVKALENLLRALDFLPPESDRRYVLELRYLDLLSWGMVAEVAHMSRSNCFNKASAGIRELLGYDEVQEMIRGQ